MIDYNESEFKKRIRISEKKLEKIKKIKGKKSAAGKLDEIIDYYLQKNKL